MTKDMLILGLDTSAKACSCALVQDDIVIYEESENNGLTHSRNLLPMIERVMEKSGVGIDKVDLIVVSAGPGSFTGIRIGVAAAVGIAQPLDKLCCGVSSLEAIANSTDCEDGEYLCCFMDARRGQFYNAFFDKDYNRMTEDRALSCDELVCEIEKTKMCPVLCGDGAELCYNMIKDRVECKLASESYRYVHGSGVAKAAKGKSYIKYNLLKPTYLRKSQAEREREEKLKGDIK